MEAKRKGASYRVWMTVPRQFGLAGTTVHGKGGLTLRWFCQVGPELEICGYGCEDHFFELDTVNHCWEALFVSVCTVQSRRGEHVHFAIEPLPWSDACRSCWKVT